MMDQIDGVSKATPFSANEISLALPYHIQDIIRSKEVAALALKALMPEFDDNKQILRKTTTKVLIEKLDLENFVVHNTTFTDKFRVATIIIQNLYKRGYISRWNCPLRKSNKSRITTKGYILTSTGIEKYAEITDVKEKTLSVDKINQNIDKINQLVKQHEATVEYIEFYKSYLLELEDKFEKDCADCQMNLHSEINKANALKLEIQNLVS